MLILFSPDACYFYVIFESMLSRIIYGRIIWFPVISSSPKNNVFIVTNAQPPAHKVEENEDPKVQQPIA